MGSVPTGKFVRRQGAAAGDHIFVTGTIGDAALGLAVRSDPSAFAKALTDDNRAFLLDRYLRPRPRLALAETLRAHASAALDISDGLLKDFSRLADQLGFLLELAKVPLSKATRAALAHDPNIVQAILAGGDDYELLIAVPPASVAGFTRRETGIQVSDLGVLDADPALKFWISMARRSRWSGSATTFFPDRPGVLTLRVRHAARAQHWPAFRCLVSTERGW